MICIWFFADKEVFKAFDDKCCISIFSPIFNGCECEEATYDSVLEWLWLLHLPHVSQNMMDKIMAGFESHLFGGKWMCYIDHIQAVWGKFLVTF